MELTPSQLIKRLRNYSKKHNFWMDTDDIIDMFDNLEEHTIKGFNAYIKKAYN